MRACIDKCSRRCRIAGVSREWVLIKRRQLVHGAQAELSLGSPVYYWASQQIDAERRSLVFSFLFFSFLFFSFLFFSFLSFPFLSFPFLSFPFLFCSVLSYDLKL